MKTYLVIHHSLTADGQTVSWQAIRRYHIETNGWDDIGYHLGVEMIGDRYEMLVGRPLLARAAACKEQNLNALGIHVCFIGNFDLTPPPIDMLRFSMPHLSAVRNVFRIPVDEQHVIGHTFAAPYKSCPGKMFSMAALRVMLAGAS